MNRSRLKDQLINDESLELKPYKDSVGKLTIGVGRNLDDVGISRNEAIYLLNNDIDRVVDEIVGEFHWYDMLDDVRQEVVVNMVFNLGLSRFKGFKLAIKAISSGDYEWASQELLDSKWASQVGNRALRLSEAMRRGEWA